MNTKNDLPVMMHRLLRAGVNLMSTKGFNATTLGDVCDEAGVKKGSFYLYFESKDSFGEAIISYCREADLQACKEAPFYKLTDPLARVMGRLDFAATFYADKSREASGCLLGALAHEMSLAHPGFRTACRKVFAGSMEDFAQDLIQAKAIYAPDASFDPDRLAILYLSTCEGSMLLGKVFGDPTVVQNSIEDFHRAVEALFKIDSSNVKPAPKVNTEK
jgi:TetR/AcrR family transcriptional repressor of nem operon